MGSDNESELLSGLPTTEAALSAAERQARQQPLLALSRGYRQRRVTLGDDKRQYDDAADAAAGAVPSPRWDLHSVAESLQQVGHACCCCCCCGCQNPLQQRCQLHTVVTYAQAPDLLGPRLS